MILQYNKTMWAIDYGDAILSLPKCATLIFQIRYSLCCFYLIFHSSRMDFSVFVNKGRKYGDIKNKKNRLNVVREIQKYPRKKSIDEELIIIVQGMHLFYCM